MADIGRKEFDPLEESIAIDTLERYSGSPALSFQDYLLLTNFPRYVEYFAESRKVEVLEGSMFKVAHSPREKISILDFKIGSPAAALVIDLCANLPVKASLMLGMCGGLRKQFFVGDYFVPLAAIRGGRNIRFLFSSSGSRYGKFSCTEGSDRCIDEGKNRTPYWDHSYHK